MSGIMYPPRNSEISFLEPYPRKELSGQTIKYYIKVEINGAHIQEIRIIRNQNKEIMDSLIRTDKKLTGAIVKCDSHCRFLVLRHSPQTDFFEILKEEKNV